MTTSTSVERRRTRARRALLSLTTILCSGLAVPALAATASPYKNVDANGVDLTDGSFQASVVDGTIGSGVGALSLVHYDALTTNWPMMYLTQTQSGSTFTVQVTIGNTTDTFVGTGPTLTSKYASGATFTMGGIYRTPDGTTITFSNQDNEQGGASNLCDANNANNCTLLASAITRPDGMVTSFDWDVHPNCATVFNSDGGLDCNYGWRLAAVSNSAGYGIAFNYLSDTVPIHQFPSGNWFRLASADYKNGGVTKATSTYSYSTSGTITTLAITTAGGRTWRISSDGGGHVTAIRRPSTSSDTTQVTYGANGVSQVLRDGITTTYGRTLSGSTATTVVTDASSHTTTVVSNMSIYRPTQVIDPLSRVTTFAYDTSNLGHLTEITYPEGNKTAYGYDARWNVASATQKAKTGSGLSDIVIGAAYDATCSNTVTCNSPNSTTDARSNQTDYTYDATTGAVLTVTAPAPSTSASRPQTRYSYSTIGGVQMPMSVSACIAGTSTTCVGTANEVKTSVTYNGNLLPASLSSGAGDGSLTATTASTYDAMGNLLTVDGPLSGSADTTTYRYDADRLWVGSISADPDGSGALKRRAVRQAYNADGQPTVSELGNVNGTSDSDWMAFSSLQQSTAGYDANGRKTRVATSGGGAAYGVSEYGYDALGRVQCTALRMNSGVWSAPLADTCTGGTAGTDGPDRIAKTSYDAAGQVTLVQSAYGTATQADEAMAYNANGTVATATDAHGNKTTYEYDGFDRLLKTRYPNPTTSAGTSSTTNYEQMVYDAYGRLTSRRLRGYAADSTRHIDFSYDELGRITTKDLPSPENDTSYTYDLFGRLTQATQGSVTDALTYDALGRVVQDTQPNGGVTYAYDLAGQRTGMSWPDSFLVGYNRLATGELSSVVENGATVFAQVAAVYSRDDLGRVLSVGHGNGTSTYALYDGASRPYTMTHDLGGSANDLSTQWSYNPAGQINVRASSNDAYVYGGLYNHNSATAINGLNQATASDSTAIGYDARGNTTSIGTSSYTYSLENLLKTGPNGTTLSYDPLGRLTTVASSGGTTRFVYDGGEIAAEVDASGAILRRYIRGDGADEPVAWYEGSGTSDRRYLHADERGSIVAVTNAAGASIATDTYDEYGNPGLNNVGRFGYTGQAWLPELGLWYYKARMYAPQLGRFLQTDPIGYGDGMNSYGYVHGDPVNWNDELGEKKRKPPVITSGDIIVTGSRASGGGGSGASGGGASPTPLPLSDPDPQPGPDVIVIGVKPQKVEPPKPTIIQQIRPYACFAAQVYSGNIAEGTFGAVGGAVTSAAIKTYRFNRGVIGAEIGAEAGSLLGPVGAVGGFVVGGLVGYYAGNYIQSKICGK